MKITDSEIAITCGLAGLVYVAIGVWYAFRKPKPRKVPIPIRSVLASLPADDPTVYRACVDSLYEAAMELAR